MWCDTIHSVLGWRAKRSVSLVNNILSGLSRRLTPGAVEEESALDSMVFRWCVGDWRRKLMKLSSGISRWSRSRSIHLFVSGNMKDPLESGIRRDCVSPESFWSKVNKTIRSTRGCGLVSVGCILWRLTLVTVDDAGSNGVSFICNNGTDLDAGADTHWVQGNIWTSFVSCPGDSLICGFETKGQTLFPDNSEIDRVRFYCCSLDS